MKSEIIIICERCENKYKTQKGYDNHITNNKCYLNCRYCGNRFKTDGGKKRHQCSSHPDKVKERNLAAQDAERIRIFAEKEREEIIQSILSSNPDFNCKVGDKYFYVYEQIIKPTHEPRFNRMVRVRYEAVKRFSFVPVEVKIISINPPPYIKNSEILTKWRDWIYVNNSVRTFDLITNKADCEAKAAEKQKNYDEACAFASFCR